MLAAAPIFFHYQVSFKFLQRTISKAVIARIFSDHGVGLSRLDYIFCSDEHVLAINKQFLQHDTYTDIITFPLNNDPRALEGEIYISVDRVRENAQSFGQPFLKELNRVLFHGALHLCGYNDHKAKEVKLMRAAEEQYLTLRFT